MKLRYDTNKERKPHGYWTKERCYEEALKYNSKKDFRKYSPTPCSKARTNKWTDDICSHMDNLIKPTHHCLHSVALKNEWLDEICDHMSKKNN